MQVNGRVVDQPDRTRVWRYHKPEGLVTTHKDPEGRPTVFEKLKHQLPRVVSVGRLDLTSEGLLLLTNDGGLARQLELPSTGWLRRYRVRVFGVPNEGALKSLAHGVTVEGVRYGPIEAAVDARKGDNTWLTVSLREGRNREVRRVMAHLGLSVSRLIRVAYGPFQLGTLERGGIEEIPAQGAARATAGGCRGASAVATPPLECGSLPAPGAAGRWSRRRGRGLVRPPIGSVRRCSTC